MIGVEKFVNVRRFWWLNCAWMDIGNIVWSQQHQNMNKTTRLWHKHVSQQANM